MTREVTCELIFDAPPADAYRAYWDLRRWPEIFANIVSAETTYDDGVHQYFTMQVQTKAGLETVRGVRFGTPPRRIDLCQFDTAPDFSTMRGSWTFSPIEQGGRICTHVIARRIFQSVSPQTNRDTASAVEALLQKNLQVFSSYLSRKSA